jgi:tetraacyldisaccharide 4'-kinase
VALPAGSRAPIAETGEEPQLLLRSGLVPVGIARNRAAIARQMTKDISPDVFLLDDGFQHWQLARDFDIVLVDSLDPWRGGLPPGGRLREDAGALARAQAIVMTRTQPHRTYAGLLAEIRSANPTAPIFRARVETDQPPFAPGEKVGAFCGLAQPETFRATLLSLGCEPVFFKVFPDHHKYSEVELTAMAAGAPVIATNAGGTGEVVEHDVTGLLVSVGDELAQRVVAHVPRHLTEAGPIRRRLLPSDPQDAHALGA